MALGSQVSVARPRHPKIQLCGSCLLGRLDECELMPETSDPESCGREAHSWNPSQNEDFHPPADFHE